MAVRTKSKKAKKKQSSGRPSTYTLKLGDLICALLAEGKSLRAICRLDRMPHLSTVLLWVVKGERGDEQYKEFSEQYAHAREAQMEALLDEVVEISDDDRNDYGFKDGEDKDGKGAKLCIMVDNINRAKLRIETRFKYASKMHRRKFGEKVTTEITGKDGGPIETHAVTESERAAGIARILDAARARGNRPPSNGTDVVGTPSGASDGGTE